MDPTNRTNDVKRKKHTTNNLFKYNKGLTAHWRDLRPWRKIKNKFNEGLTAHWNWVLLPMVSTHSRVDLPFFLLQPARFTDLTHCNWSNKDMWNEIHKTVWKNICWNFRIMELWSEFTHGITQNGLKFILHHSVMKNCKFLIFEPARALNILKLYILDWKRIWNKNEFLPQIFFLKMLKNNLK